jgi:hypothetical protein
MPSSVTGTPVSKSILKTPMKLINESTGEMEFRVCGSRHLASVKPSTITRSGFVGGGHYCRGSWQCSNQDCPTKNH